MHVEVVALFWFTLLAIGLVLVPGVAYCKSLLTEARREREAAANDLERARLVLGRVETIFERRGLSRFAPRAEA